MAFLLNCPNCGDRNVHEFRFGGEATSRPEPNSMPGEWLSYFYNRGNVAGVQREWWNHRYGCRKWFLALRHTVSNQIQETLWP